MAFDDVDSFIRKLSDHIGKNWKKVARELKFSPTDVDAIEYKARDDLKEQIHLFFEAWKMREGSRATVKMLDDALKKANLQGILDVMTGRQQSSDIIPVQESSQGSSPICKSELELIRQKRVQKMSSTGSDKSESLPKFEPSERAMMRSVSTPSRSLAFPEPSSKDAGRLSSSTSSFSPATCSKGNSSSPMRKEFEVEDVVKVDHDPNPWYGVIKWVGSIPDLPEKVAGIEMEEKVDGCHSGKVNEVQYFTCEDGYGLLMRLSLLKPDDRFDQPKPLLRANTPTGEEVEKDKRTPSASPRLVDSPAKHTSKSGEPLSPSFLPSPNSSKTKVPEMLAFESTDGDSASSASQLCVICPGDVAGFIIGKDGKNRKDVESETNTKIVVEKNEHDKSANTKVLIFGEKEEDRYKALALISNNIRRKTALLTATTETIMIPSQLCGKVIGRKGSTVQAIQKISGARIDIERKEGFEALQDGPRKCTIKGSAEQIEKAKELIAMAQRGEDIAQAAAVAAAMIKFLKEELKKEGFAFPGLES